MLKYYKEQTMTGAERALGWVNIAGNIRIAADGGTALRICCGACVL